MIFGIGTDIIEVDRVKSKLEKVKGFREKLFTEREIEYCESKKLNKYQSYAARFAAKEAFLKALGTGYRDGLKFTEVEVINDELGKPEITIFGTTLKKFNDLQINNIHVSISHIKNLVNAFVVLEKYSKE